MQVTYVWPMGSFSGFDCLWMDVSVDMPRNIEVRASNCPLQLYDLRGIASIAAIITQHASTKKVGTWTTRRIDSFN